MSVSVGQAHEAFKRAREQVLASGVGQQEADGVAAVLAAYELINTENAGRAASGASVKRAALPETFAEWSARYELDSHYDRFLAAAVYLWEEEGKATFTTDDLMELVKKARWEKPKNPADVIGKAAKRLYFAEADNGDGGEDTKKRWRLTNSGLSQFQNMRKDSAEGGTNGR